MNQTPQELQAALEAERAAHARTTHRAAQYAVIIESAPLAIYAKDEAHRYVLVNHEYERLAGASREAILGKEDFALFPQEVAGLFRAQDVEVARVGHSVAFKETIPLRDGVHTFITSKFPVPMGHDEAPGVAGLCTEVTALEAAKVALEDAQAELVSRERLAALGELSASVAHEVRNPLGVIFNALSALKRLPRESDEVQPLLDIIGEESERLDRMVGALLELVRPVSLAPEPVALAPLLAAAIEAASPLKDHPAEAELDVQVPTPTVTVDPRVVRRVVENLVSNALHTTGRRKPVRVEASLEGAARDELRIAVVDDGPGVPKEYASRIFDPFFSTRATGTGMGLAVARRLAAAHRGSLRLRESPGGGATFELRVPLQGR